MSIKYKQYHEYTQVHKCFFVSFLGAFLRFGNLAESVDIGCQTVIIARLLRDITSQVIRKQKQFRSVAGKLPIITYYRKTRLYI